MLCIEVIIMTKYEAVAQAIKNDIENGVYKEGQPIPTEELLTAQYDVSRQTIRKALSLLVEDNLIIKRQGSGSVVRVLSYYHLLRAAVASSDSSCCSKLFMSVLPSIITSSVFVIFANRRISSAVNLKDKL